MKNYKKLLLLATFLIVGCGTGVGNSSSSGDSSGASSSTSSSQSEVVLNDYSLKFVRGLSTTGTVEYCSLVEGTKYQEQSKVTAEFKLAYEVSAEEAPYLGVTVNGKYFTGRFADASVQTSDTIYVDFVMPSADAEVYYSYQRNIVDEAGISMILEDNEYVYFAGFDASKKYSAKNTLFKAYLIVQPGYKVEKVEYKEESAEEWTEVSSYSLPKNGYGSINLYGVSTDVTVKVTGEFVGAYKINYMFEDRVALDKYSTVDYFVKEATPGDPINYTYAGADGYHVFGPAVVDGVKIENDSNNVGSFDRDSRLSFAMPENDVTVVFNTRENWSVEFDENENIESAYILSDYDVASSVIEKPAPGSEFYVAVNAKAGYALTGAKFDTDEEFTPAEISSESGVTYVALTMPDNGDAFVELEVIAAAKVSIENVAGGTLSAPADTYAVGSTVEMSFEADSVLYELESVSIKDHPEVEVTISYYSWGAVDSISFVMPEFDVVVVPNVVKVPSTVINVDIPINEDDHYTVRGYETSIQIGSDEDNQTIELKQGEEIGIDIDLATGYKKPVNAILKDAEGNVISEHAYYYYSDYDCGFEDLVVPESDTPVTLTVEFVAQNPVTYSVVDNGLTGYEIVYSLGGAYGQKVSDLGTVYPGDKFGVTVSGDAGEGYAFALAVKDSEGNPLAQEWGGTYVVSGDFTIEVSKIAVCKITIVGEEYVNSGYGINFSDSSYNSVDPNAVVGGTSVNTYLYSSSNFNVTITCNGEEIFNQDSEYNSLEFEFTVTGDCVMTITPIVAE